MKWFAAVIVMECRVGRSRAALWDEQLRLIRAQSAEGAYKAAQDIGESDQAQYENAAGEKVRWRFLGVGELEELLEQRIVSGVEVFSTLTRGGRPREPPKKQLIAFWSARNMDRTADELLAKPLKKFAPR